VGSTLAGHTALEISALLPAIVHCVPAALLVADADYRILVANPAALSVLGARQPSLLGYTLGRFLSIELLEAARWQLSAQPGPFKYRERVEHADTVREIEVSVDVLSAAAGEYLCLALDAVPPGRTAQIERSALGDANAAYFERAHQLEAFRHVTSTFAHDFNNLLSVLMGSLEAATRRIKKSESPLEDIERALTATERSVRLTAQILQYAKRDETRAEILVPSQQVLELRGLLELILGDEIDLSIQDHSEREVSVSASQLETAVLNLVINSRDAITAPGKIEIAIEPRALSLAEAPALQIPAGDYVVIAVRDDGCGMSEDVRRRAIEPFFTTKVRGRGTGLGLSSVSGIMRTAGGCLHIASALGQGTLVELFFPVATRS